MAGVALIIGNGFDIDMGIPSRYSDFIKSKEWKGVVKRVNGFLADSSYSNHSLIAQLQLASMDSMWFDIEQEISKFVKSHPTMESRGQALDPGTQNDRFLLCILTHSIRNDVF